MTMVKVGSEELDRRLGGIPHPSIIMVEGGHGTGKTIFVGQLALGLTLSGLKGAFVSTETLTFGTLVKLREVKIDLTQAFLSGSLLFAPVNVKRFDWEKTGTTALLDSLVTYISRKRLNFAILDSFTLLASDAKEKELLEFFRRTRLLSDLGVTLIFTVHPGVFSEALLTETRSIVDVYFRLSAVTIGGRRLKSLERIKNTGGTIGGDVLSFDIDPALGLKVVPLSLSRA